MKHVSVSLSDAQHASLEAGVAEGAHASVEEYVSSLVDAETQRTQRTQRTRLETLLLEGLASPAKPWHPGSMDELRRAARARL